MGAQDVNAELIGCPGSRYGLATPALVIDLDIFEQNLARMAEFARVRGISLRPHAKTHKCAEIARRQIAAGALGICTAKLGEAEALVDSGIDSILITSPIVTERAIARLMQLNARVGDLMAVCDNSTIATKLAEAAVRYGKKRPGSCICWRAIRLSNSRDCNVMPAICSISNPATSDARNRSAHLQNSRNFAGAFATRAFHSRS
jgi:hypothetical protein